MLACILCIVYWTKSKPSKGAVTSRSPREMVKICMGDNEEVIEERQNAQNSKINDSSQLQPFLEQNYTEREWSRRVVPLNGEESLKKTFDFFEEMDKLQEIENHDGELWKEELRSSQKKYPSRVCLIFVRYQIKHSQDERNLAFWNYTYRGGFAWDGSAKQFNWHPVFMVTGMVVLFGNAAVVYRIPLTWGHNKLPWKLLHAGLLLLSLILSVLGLCAVFDFHNKNQTPNLYSLHSWVGICTTALFTAQWVMGFTAFLLPCAPMAARALIKPAHVWMGGIILVLSIVSCISGINEKLFFALKGNTNQTLAYSSLPPEAIAANSLGVVIVAFGLVVLKILSNQIWQRPEPGYDEGVYRPLAYDGS
ncbi:cytochrome b ascorbate-dependent protein [Pimephales promelas]|nr:cytochrome b ascorbate-dependent protein [Pimephales promelas]